MSLNFFLNLEPKDSQVSSIIIIFFRLAILIILSTFVEFPNTCIKSITFVFFDIAEINFSGSTFSVFFFYINKFWL